MDNDCPDGDNQACAGCGHERAPTLPGQPVANEAALVVRDVNGHALKRGDTVTVIKDLKANGAAIALKQGSVMYNIRLVDGDDEHADGHSDKIKRLVLKACFLKEV